MASLRFLPLFLFAFLLAACGAPEQPGSAGPAEEPADPPDPELSLAGELFYLERIALPPDSVMVVELRTSASPDSGLLAEVREELGTRQVPIPFELTVAAAELPEIDELVFRGGIVSSPGPLRVTDHVVIEARDGAVDLGQLRLRQVPDAVFGIAYRCGEQMIALGSLGQYERLVVDGEVFDLRPEVSASGARYVAVDGSNTEFWSRGEEAMVTVNGGVLANCMRLRAPALPLRALGHEPSWLVLIGEDAISLNLDFGARQIDFPYAAPEISAAGIRYVTEADGGRLTLILDRQACPDTMADLVYPYRARYTFEGEVGLGCGGDPREVLTGGEWQIERIGDETVVAGTVPTIEFLQVDGEDRFAGRASCNRYMGGFQLTGEGLNLSPAASTLMACPDEAQALQERRLLALLGEVYGFGIDQEGRLILRTGTSTIVARR